MITFRYNLYFLIITMKNIFEVIRIQINNILILINKELSNFK